MTSNLSPDEIETPYRNADIDLSHVNPFNVRNTIRKITQWQWLTHHPQCSRYKNHYLEIGPYKICLGCTGLYTGWAFLLIWFLISRTVFLLSPYILLSLFFTGILVSILHLIIKPEKKWIKGISRLLLGFTFGSYTIGIILAPAWWVRIVMVLLAAAPMKFYNHFRGKFKNIEYCLDCPMVDLDPPCQPLVNTNLKIRQLRLHVQAELLRLKEKGQVNAIEMLSKSEKVSVVSDESEKPSNPDHSE